MSYYKKMKFIEKKKPNWDPDKSLIFLPNLEPEPPF